MKKYFLLLFWLIMVACKPTMIATQSTDCIDEKTKNIIKSIKHGCRPEPSVYMREECLTSHAAMFAEGASYLVPKDVLDRFGRKLLGRQDGQFVMCKKEMDKLLQADAVSITHIEKQLGIPAGLWAGKTLVRIDILNPKALKLRIPSGNEAAANELWIPGGKLPTGYTEGVIDQIPEGQYNETILQIK